jgi:hypothetical protein
VRVAIQDGRIGIASLAVRGFGSSAWPDVDSLTPMPAPPMPPGFDLPAQVTE